MTANQNFVHKSRGPITVRVCQEARFYRGVAALWDGDGTADSPLHFVLLACHADMADESPIAISERLTITLAEAVLTCLRKQPDNLRDVLRSSNACAVEMDSYYSIVVGRLVQRHVTLSALGKVEAVRVSGDIHESLVTPTAVRIRNRAILTAAFGIGFSEEALQIQEFDLREDEMLLTVVGGDGAASRRRHVGADALIDSVAGDSDVFPPVIAVVRPVLPS